MTVNERGRTIFVADAHRGDGKRFVVRADDKLTAFLELESAIDRLQQDEVLKPLQCCCSVTVQPRAISFRLRIAESPKALLGKHSWVNRFAKCEH